VAVTPDDVVEMPDGRRGLVLGVDGDRLRVLLLDVRPSEIIDASASTVTVLRPWIPVIRDGSTRSP
jgi:hypothetical protein